MSYEPIRLNGDDIEFYGEVIGKWSAPDYQRHEFHAEMFFTSHDLDEAVIEAQDKARTEGYDNKEKEIEEELTELWVDERISDEEYGFMFSRLIGREPEALTNSKKDKPQTIEDLI